MNTLLILNVPAEQEDDLVDYLLQLDCITGFASWPVSGHGSHGHMTIAEQVTGRRKRVRAELLMRAEDVAQVVDGLAANVGRDIMYWQQPVGAQGRID